LRKHKVCLRDWLNPDKSCSHQGRQQDFPPDIAGASAKIFIFLPSLAGFSNIFNERVRAAATQHSFNESKGVLLAVLLLAVTKRGRRE